MSNEKEIKIPAKASHRVKVISSSKPAVFEKEVNDFLKTISDERRLISQSFMCNPKTGLYVDIINYTNISPMTKEEWAEKQEVNKKFTAGFAPKDLMPDEEPVVEKV